MLRSSSIFGSRRGTAGFHANRAVGQLVGLRRPISPIGAISPINIQRRHFIFQSMQNMANMKKITEAMEGTTDDRKKAAYVRALAAYAPKQAMTQIERGWESGKLPVNEEILREYLKSAAALKKLDSLNITGLMTLVQKQNGGVGGSAPGGNVSPQTLALLLNSGQQRFSAGGAPSEPLYIATQEASWKTQAWRFLRNGVSLFLLLSFVGAVMDEKGGGGLASRMGMGSVVHQAEDSDKSFKDVVGIDEAKAELEEIVMYLKDSKRFTRLGGKLPKGILLTGPPGTGKTLLARAIAGEAKVPFFYTSGSEFEEMYVGVGARRVRDLFEAAKAKSPCIIFIDEIDAIGGSRHLKEQSAMKMTLNQLLVEMDGFEQNNGVIVIAATNFPDSLDSALTRPGRFDKHVDVPPPDIGGRKAILELYAKKIPVSADVDMEQLARGTPGFSGADLYNLVNQAAVKASKDGLKAVGMAAFEYAKDKIMMGAERKSAVISPETMRVTAFHEAGHALVALKTDGCDPIHKATIMPRGRSLGMVMQLPDGDQTSMTRKQMLARLDVCMGGRVAEELVYGAENVTSGASSDIMQATRLAKAMVTKYGLSEKVGIMFLDDKEKQSGATQGKVDDEVRTLLTDSYARAKRVLETHRRELDLIAQGLIEYESLSGGEIVDLCSGTKPNAKGLRSQRPSRAAQPIQPIGPGREGREGEEKKVTSSFVSAVFGGQKTAKTPAPASASTSASISASASVPASASTNSALIAPSAQSLTSPLKARPADTLSPPPQSPPTSPTTATTSTTTTATASASVASKEVKKEGSSATSSGSLFSLFSSTKSTPTHASTPAPAAATAPQSDSINSRSTTSNSSSSNSNSSSVESSKVTVPPTHPTFNIPAPVSASPDKPSSSPSPSSSASASASAAVSADTSRPSAATNRGPPRD